MGKKMNTHLVVVWGLKIQCHKSLSQTEAKKLKPNMSDEI